MKTLHVKASVITAALVFSAVGLQPTAEAAYTPLPAEHNLLTNGDFEASPDWVAGWTGASNDPIQHSGLVSGSNTAARLYKEIGDFSNSTAQNSPSNWTLDFLFAVGGTTSADILDLRIAPLSGSESITLRVQNDGTIQAHSGSWQDLSIEGTIAKSTFDANRNLNSEGAHVYRMRIVGHDFGTLNAKWDLLLATSDDFDSFSAVVTGSTILQNPAKTTTGVGRVIFRNNSTNTNNNLIVDNIWLGDTADVPEPAAVTLLGLAGIGLLGRRMRRQG